MISIVSELSPFSLVWESYFDRQFPISYSYISRQNLEKQVYKNVVNKCENYIFVNDKNRALFTSHNEDCRQEGEVILLMIKRVTIHQILVNWMRQHLQHLSLLINNRQHFYSESKNNTR